MKSQKQPKNNNQKPKQKKRKAKAKKLVRAAYGEDVHQLLKGQSQYLQTLLKPTANPGVKIPDTTFYPSCTFTTVDRFSLTANNNGVAGLFLVCGRVKLAHNVAQAASTSTTLAWNGANSDLTAANQIATLYDRIRLVSGGVFGYYTGTTLTNSGSTTTATWPRGSADFATTYTTVSAIQTRATSNIVPVSSTYYQVLYIPSDYSCFDYVNAANTGLDTGYIMMIWTGLAAGTTVGVNIVLNWEGIPLANTLNLVTPTPSKSDSLEMDVAMNHIAEAPLVAVDQGSAKQNVVKTTPTESTTQALKHHDQKDQPSFIERVVGAIGKGVNIAKDVGGAIAPLAALL